METQLYDAHPAVCQKCAGLYPPSLLKAAEDYFEYALRLQTGEIIFFRQAEIHGNYVRLHMDGEPKCDSQCFTDDNPTLPFIFARGIDIRLQSIVWCADAPNGS
jgi:hypothetical protein